MLSLRDEIGAWARGTFREASKEGLSPKACRARAALAVRRRFSHDQVRQVIERERQLGTVVYGILLRVLRGPELARS